MNTQTIELSGKRYEVSFNQLPKLNQLSKELWVATGEYRGEQLEGRGHSAPSALRFGEWRPVSMMRRHPHKARTNFGIFSKLLNSRHWPNI